jgi:O-acetylhomoserine (thiol)-lyase
MNLAAAGDQIVAASTLYGGTLNLLRNTLPHYGITTVFAEPDDLDTFAAATTEKPNASYVESIGNPNGNLVDLAQMAQMAQCAGACALIVDKHLWHPIPDPADRTRCRHCCPHSTTKYIGGHGTSAGRRSCGCRSLRLHLTEIFHCCLSLPDRGIMAWPMPATWATWPTFPHDAG